MTERSEVQRARSPVFPLTAVVGQEQLKLALVLNAVNPRIGGLLIRGEKGSAKSTAARGLAALLPGAAPFVELPIGATEDRVVGALDLEAALTAGERRLQPGLLHAAHQGVLYVDEVNLLPDHLVDVLLDVAASGVNRVERDGLAVEHAAHFVLCGSMNPEEGELRPQLLDRFGLAVEVRAPVDPVERADAVQRRLAFERDPDTFLDAYAKDEQRLTESITSATAAHPDVRVPSDVAFFTSALCAQLGAEGLRADLVLVRAAVALAALDSRDEVTRDDILRLAPLALAHRRRRGPFDAPGIDPDELDAAARDAGEMERGDEAPDPGDEAGAPPRPPSPDVAVTINPTGASAALGRRTRGQARRGGVVAARPPVARPDDLAVNATVAAVAARRALEPSGPAVALGDLREAVREARTAHLVVLAVDTSGSMGARRRIEAAKGAALSLLLDAYQRRDRVALVTFRGGDAEVMLRPTGSVEVARARLAELPTGGRTPLAAGILAALEVIRQARGRDPGRRPVLVLVTDGRTTAGPDPYDAARAVAGAGVDALVIDAENGPTRLGLARPLADAMAGRYLALPDLDAGGLHRAVAAALDE